jgi:hypothetical protein
MGRGSAPRSGNVRVTTWEWVLFPVLDTELAERACLTTFGPTDLQKRQDGLLVRRADLLTAT